MLTTDPPNPQGLLRLTITPESSAPVVSGGNPIPDDEKATRDAVNSVIDLLTGKTPGGSITSTGQIVASSNDAGFVTIGTETGFPTIGGIWSGGPTNVTTTPALKFVYVVNVASDAILTAKWANTEDASIVLTFNSQLGAGFTAFQATRTAGAVLKLGFFAAAPVAQPQITGALSAVTDANAKAVLTSIITALTNLGLVTNGTT